jgi:hypothetical protein
MALAIQKFVRPANAENLLLKSRNALISKLKILMRRLPRKLNRQKFSQLKLMMRGGVQSVLLKFWRWEKRPEREERQRCASP